MRSRWFLSVVLSVLYGVSVAACTTDGARTAAEVYVAQCEACEDASAAIEAREAPMRETLEVGRELVLQQDDAWKFSPDFVFEGTPEAALTRLEDAIKKRDKAEFCESASDLERCNRIFDEEIALLSGVYVNDIDERLWLETSTGLSITISDITFLFVRTRSGWKMSDLCTTGTVAHTHSFFCR